MQILSEIVAGALERSTISLEHLYEPEDRLIGRLCSAETSRKEWERFIRLSRVSQSGPGPWARMIVAKKRHINPLVKGMGRVTDYDADFKADRSAYLSWNLEYWVEGTFGQKNCRHSIRFTCLLVNVFLFPFV